RRKRLRGVAIVAMSMLLIQLQIGYSELRRGLRNTNYALRYYYRRFDANTHQAVARPTAYLSPTHIMPFGTGSFRLKPYLLFPYPTRSEGLPKLPKTTM